MEMLFNVQLLDHDFSSQNHELEISPLSSKDAEQAIVDKLYALEIEQYKLIELAECYAEDIFANSSNDISVKMNKIISSGVPKISSTVSKIDTIGLEFTTGLISRSVIIGLYSNNYWMMGGNVNINNDSIVQFNPAGNLDSIMTYDIMNGFFIQDIAGETLSRCSVSYMDGSGILDPINLDDYAVNYDDLKRFFFLKSDNIDLEIKTVKTQLFEINNSTITGTTVNLSGLVVIKKLIVDSGVVNLSEFQSNFLIEGGFVRDDAYIRQGTETNSVLMFDAVLLLQESRAPKSDWRTTDLRKTDRKPNLFIDSMISDVFSGIAPSQSDDYHSVVCYEELEYAMSKVISELQNIKVCDDS